MSSDTHTLSISFRFFRVLFKTLFLIEVQPGKWKWNYIELDTDLNLEVKKARTLHKGAASDLRWKNELNVVIFSL